MTKEETGKGSGDAITNIELECGCCSGCCGIPVAGQLDPILDEKKKDPTEQKSPPQGVPPQGHSRDPPKNDSYIIHKQC